MNALPSLFSSTCKSFHLQVGACRPPPTTADSASAPLRTAMAHSQGPQYGPRLPSFPPPAHFYGGVPKPSSAPPHPKAMTPDKWLEEAEQMDELIATFKSRHPHFAFDDDPSLPYTCPKSVVWGGPGWQKKKRGGEVSVYEDPFVVARSGVA